MSKRTSLIFRVKPAKYAWANVEYYEKAMKRIKLERQQLTLF